MTVSGLPFDDIRALLDDLPEAETQVGDLVRDRNKLLFGSGDTLGRMAVIHEWLAEWSGVSPTVNRPMIAIFAGTHRATTEVQQAEVAARVAQVAAGGAPVNQICGAHELGLKVFDLALPYPVGDIRIEDALDEKSAAATIAFGMEAVAGGIDLLCLADCSGAFSPAPAAIFAALYEGNPADFTDDESVADIAGAAIRRIGGKTDPLEVLRRAGGRETSALAGAILAARTQHVPVILDGAGPLAAAAVLEAVKPGAAAHCMAAQRAFSPQRAEMLQAANIKGMLDLEILLEEGEAGAMAAVFAKMAAAVHTQTQKPDVS